MRIDKNREINIFYPALVINDYYSAEFKDWIALICDILHHIFTF